MFVSHINGSERDVLTSETATLSASADSACSLWPSATCARAAVKSATASSAAIALHSGVMSARWKKPYWCAVHAMP
jgi:hypothetical protein